VLGISVFGALDDIGHRACGAGWNPVRQAGHVPCGPSGVGRPSYRRRVRCMWPRHTRTSTGRPRSPTRCAGSSTPPTPPARPGRRRRQEGQGRTAQKFRQGVRPQPATLPTAHLSPVDNYPRPGRRPDVYRQPTAVADTPPTIPEFRRALRRLCHKILPNAVAESFCGV
jgi:hypothetical protein